MKLYLLTQNVNNEFDTYDSCIVCAENEEEAKKTHPSEYVSGNWWEDGRDESRCWVSKLDDVQIKYLGEADSTIEKGCILASFNAG